MMQNENKYKRSLDFYINLSFDFFEFRDLFVMYYMSILLPHKVVIFSKL